MNNEPDNFDEIADLLKKTPPVQPRAEAKNSSIYKAMEEFDKKYANSSQGNETPIRLIDTVKTVLQTIRGEFTMKKAYILAGSVSMIAIAAAILESPYNQIPEKNEAVKAAADTVAHITSRGVEVEQPQSVDKNLAGSTQESVQTFADQVDNNNPDLPQKNETDTQYLTRRTNSQTNTHEELAKDSKQESNAVPESLVLSAPQKSASAPMEKVAEYKKARIAIGAADSAVGYAIGSAGVVASPSIMPYPVPCCDDNNPYQYHDEGRDKFEKAKENPIKVVKEEPVSTFSIDVDTSSYSFMRSSINQGVLPQKDAVRIEEMVNYFPYNYEIPKDKAEPFKANVSVFPTPWNKDTKIMHIGIKGYQIDNAEKPHSNLVFLIDTSGSMNEPNKLPLLKNSLKLLLDSLKDDDTISIVTYAGSAGVALEPTKAKDRNKILGVLDSLNYGGSTAGAEGIRTAYQLAEQNFDKKGVNRVILATDGDFNVGITDQNELKTFIEKKRETGVFLSVLGFGRGNYNDALMQTLAQNGNGNAAYIDNLSEARKVLVEEAGSTLFTIAKDVKIQVEFNPAQVAEYRLIGYETRMLNREDFNNDKVDAGDIGAGHAVTAIYEITPKGSPAQMVDELRYKKTDVKKDIAESVNDSGEYAFVKIRYKLPDSDTSKLITTPVDSKLETKELSGVNSEAKFATAVTAFAQILRGDSYIKSYSYDDAISLAESAKGEDKFGYRTEFINLMRLAKTLQSVKPQGSDSNGQWRGQPPVQPQQMIIEYNK